MKNLVWHPFVLFRTLDTPPIIKRNEYNCMYILCTINALKLYKATVIHIASYMLNELFICSIIIILSCKEYINIT